MEQRLSKDHERNLMRILSLMSDLFMDFLDRGATRLNTSNSMDSLKAALAVLVSILTGYVEITKLIIGPEASPYASFLIPAIVFVGSLHVVSRKRNSSPSILLGTEGYHPTLEYEYPQVLRVTAKFLSLALCLILVRNGIDVLPNILTGNSYISGFICDFQNEKPVSKTKVIALDRFGRTVSVSLEYTDDSGFFVLDLKPMAMSPFKLELSNSICSNMQILVAEATVGNRACNEGSQDIRKEITRRWRIECKS